MLKKFSLILLILLLPIKPLFACEENIYANQNVKPKAYLENGHAKGILIEMMDYVGKDIDCKFTYHFSTWARAYKSMIDGKGGVIGLSLTQSRLEIIDFSDVMYHEDILLVTHKDTPFAYSGIQDLAGKTVGASRASSYGDDFEQALESSLFTFVGDNGDPARRLNLVAKKRLDVAIILPGTYAFKNVFTEHPELIDIKDSLYIIPKAFKKDPNYLGFAKTNDHKAFLKKFNRSMEKARQDGVFKKIEEKYHH